MRCKECKYPGAAPSPAIQTNAWVTDRTPPEEMAEAARERNGRDGLCTVPTCRRLATVLDHRVAWTKGGKTCVRNLYPMCEEHHLSKGDSDYQDWLRKQSRTVERRADPPER